MDRPLKLVYICKCDEILVYELNDKKEVFEDKHLFCKKCGYAMRRYFVHKYNIMEEL